MLKRSGSVVLGPAKEGEVINQRPYICVILEDAIITLDLLFDVLTDLCRSSTAGQIAVGGTMRFAYSPKVHSFFTDEAQRL